MEYPEHWQKWARSLQRNHLTGLVLTLLEGAAPVRTILSQTLFGVSPFFDADRKHSLHEFAETLDDSEKCRDFASCLRNGGAK